MCCVLTDLLIDANKLSTRGVFASLKKGLQMTMYVSNYKIYPGIKVVRIRIVVYR